MKMSSSTMMLALLVCLLWVSPIASSPSTSTTKRPSSLRGILRPHTTSKSKKDCPHHEPLPSTPPTPPSKGGSSPPTPPASHWRHFPWIPIPTTPPPSDGGSSSSSSPPPSTPPHFHWPHFPWWPKPVTPVAPSPAGGGSPQPPHFHWPPHWPKPPAFHWPRYPWPGTLPPPPSAGGSPPSPPKA